MNNHNLQSWTKKLGKAWTNRDAKAAAYLFAKNCKYYESALENPCNNWSDILKLWQTVPQNQKNVVFKFKILAISDKFGIVNWDVKRTLLPSNEKQVIDGIFQISLDKNGLCIFFKQWRKSKILKYKN